MLDSRLMNAFLTLVVCILVSTVSVECAEPKYILPGYSLNAGTQLVYQYYYTYYNFRVTTDCNVIFYDQIFKSTVYWESWTGGQGVAGQCYLYMQEDCNLVLYPDHDSGPGYGKPALWATGTQNMGSNCYFQLAYFNPVGAVAGAVYDGANNGAVLWTTHNQ